MKHLKVVLGRNLQETCLNSLWKCLVWVLMMSFPLRAWRQYNTITLSILWAILILGKGFTRTSHYHITFLQNKWVAMQSLKFSLLKARHLNNLNSRQMVLSPMKSHCKESVPYDSHLGSLSTVSFILKSQKASWKYLLQLKGFIFWLF